MGLSRYPFVSNNMFYDSTGLVQNKSCNKCKEKDCIDFYSKGSNLESYTCSKGFDNLLFTIDSIKFLFNGFVYTNNDTIPKGRKDARIDWLINKDELINFINKINEIEKYIKNKINSTKEQNFSMFHDFKTTMNIVFTCTQDVIYALPGSNFNEKLEGGGKSIRDLYSSLSLITSQLGMMDVIVNPTSITFGNKREINIYRLFHKMSVLFTHISIKRRIKIDLNNIGYIPDCLCYESIEFIPLILIDNAIKYSINDSNIEIIIKLTYKIIHVKISNWGPIVNDIDANKIFDKFYRAENAVNFTKEGVGMGLWVAQKILETHKSKLTYNNTFSYEENNLKIGVNTFEFYFPID